MSAAPISGRTRIVGLFGWPVSHSVSPAMHNAAFDALGMDWRYVPLPVNPEPPARIAEAVRGVAAMGMAGVNVTVPHKQAVMPHLDRLTPAARAIGAVNTIHVEEDGALLGDNTDARGFIADLDSHEVIVAGMNVLVLGAGGSSRAVFYGLGSDGAPAHTVWKRTHHPPPARVSGKKPHITGCRMSAARLPDDLAAVAESAQIIVNCTSLGMTPNVNGLPWNDGLAFHPGQVVYDLVYNPPVTRLLRQAGADGARPIGGLGMLIWQGAIAFELWSGRRPPVEVMEAAALRQLRRS